MKTEWIVHYGMYREHHYGAVKSRDLKNWEMITDRLEFPQGGAARNRLPRLRAGVG